MAARSRNRPSRVALKPPVGPKRPGKTCVDLGAELLEQLRLISQQVPSARIEGSISGLARKVLGAEVQRIQRQYNDGKPFKAKRGQRPAARRGRPVSLG